MAVKAVPEGSHTITPHLVVNDAPKALEFYKNAFGAQIGGVHYTPDGKVMHAEFKIGDSRMFLADEFPGHGFAVAQDVGWQLCCAESFHGRYRQGLQPGRECGRDRDHAVGEPVLGRPLRSGQGSLRPHLGAGTARRGRCAGRDGTSRPGGIRSDGERLIAAKAEIFRGTTSSRRKPCRRRWRFPTQSN